MLLIISNKIDQHVDIVITHLYQEGIPFFRWNTEDFLTNHKFSLYTNGLNENITIELVAEERKINLNHIHKVWYRRPGKITVTQEITNQRAIDLTTEETQTILQGLWLLLKDRIWISNPISNQKMGNKLFQIKLAQKVGLQLPESIITNDPMEARKFIKSHEKVITKMISGRIPKNSRGNSAIYTNQVSKSISDDQLDKVKFVPTLFQEYIPKKVELRITIVENDVFTCAIDSQKSERTRVDWRRYDFKNVPHFSFELPQQIKNQLINFMREENLKFATFDMILMPNEKYIFLECNPNGQWYWIEELTGLPITKRLIQLLKS